MPRNPKVLFLIIVQHDSENDFNFNLQKGGHEKMMIGTFFQTLRLFFYKQRDYHVKKNKYLYCVVKRDIYISTMNQFIFSM